MSVVNYACRAASDARAVLDAAPAENFLKSCVAASAEEYGAALTDAAAALRKLAAAAQTLERCADAIAAAPAGAACAPPFARSAACSLRYNARYVRELGRRAAEDLAASATYRP